MKKLPYSLLFFCLFGMAAAKPFSLKLQQLKDIPFSQPAFVGKAGDQHVLIDRVDASGTVLYFLSPSLQLVKTLRLPYAAYSSFRFSTGNNTSISWLEKQNDTVRLQRLTLQDGELQQEQHVTLPKLPGQASLLVSRTGNTYFYHTLVVDERNHINIGGVLVNDSLRIVAHVDGSIDFNTTLERFAGPLLDAAGNVQLVIYDKLSNYHESVNIRINTISAGSKDMMEESFQFEKIKLYDLLLSDNPVTNQLHLTGFFYNGSTKTIAGVASVRLPYERVNKVAHTFSRFTNDQGDYLATGMEYVRKHDDVFKFMKLQGIYNDNGHVLLGAWLLDLPQKKIIKDGDHEQTQNTGGEAWLNPVQLGESSRLRGTALPANSTNYWVRSSEWNSNSLSRLNSPPLNTSRAAGLPASGLPANNIPRITSLNRPEKLVFFSIDPDGKFDWMQVVPAELPLVDIPGYNQLPNHFFFDRGQWRIPFYETGGEANKKTPGMVTLNLASIGRAGMQKESLLHATTGQYYFSGLWKISDTQYVSAYRDLNTGETGIATLQPATSSTAKQ